MSASPATSLCSPAARVPHTYSPRAEAFGLSDTGLVRARNEDAYAVLADLGFFAVADGVGGNAAGKVASHTAVDSVVAFFRKIASARPAPGDAQETVWRAEFASSLFKQAVQEANAVVHAAASSNPSLAGMGTTFTGLLLLNDFAVVAHVGDSRAYLLRGRRLHQLTEDHTLVNAYVQAGAMTEEEAATSELRHVIARAIGVDDHVEVDTRVVGVEPGDLFLLATDGLHGVVDDEAIRDVLLRERDLTRAASNLIELANDAGAPDNVTVVLVRVG